MSDWTSGYIADIDYTFGYYLELHPLRVKLAFLDSGIAPPEVATACELGFGQGLSVNIHAAASGVEWWGTDFNPAQAGFAQELARVSGARAKLYDQAFGEFCARTDLPDFDFIALHGILSWVSEENRRVIADFVQRKLKVGGVLYASYNALPGWAPMIPMRHLLTRHADLLAASGQGIVNRIDGALEFADALLKLNPLYAARLPVVTERFERIKQHNRHYLAHEYFNRDWHPMHFLDMAEWMSGSKLTFACSAHYLDHVDGINLTAEQQAFIRSVPDPLFREAVRDFVTNSQFRRDYWVKGARPLTPIDRLEMLRAQRVMLVIPADKVALKATGSRGEAELSPEIYKPLLEALSSHEPIPVGEIERRVAKAGVTPAHLLQALMILAGKGDVAAAQEDAQIARAKPACDRLNRHLVTRARGSGDIAHLASPVTGGGVGLERFQQLYLRELQDGKGSPGEFAVGVWQLLKAQGQTLIHEGQQVATEADAIAHLKRQGESYSRELLPLLKALGVA